MTLSVIILTKNEGRHLPDCLASAQGADEILVVDDHSLDNTVELAQAAGAKVVSHKLKSFAAQRNFALTQATGDWVFFLDADERCSPELLAAIRKHQKEHPQAAGSVVRRNFAFGQRHSFGPLKPDRVIRLFPKETVSWTGRVHEKPICPLPARPLGGHLVHLTYRNWEQYLTKQQYYATLWAEEAHAQGRTATTMTAIGRAGAGFLKMMILNLGLLGGPVTWCLCWFHSAYTLTKYLKLAEMEPLHDSYQAVVLRAKDGPPN